MNRVLRALVRHALRVPSRWLGVVALVAMGVVVFAGTRSGLDRIEVTADRLYDELGMFDACFRVPPGARAVLPDVASVRGIPGVEDARWRLRVPGAAILDDGSAAAASIELVDTERPSIGDVRLTAGEWLDPARPFEVIIDHTFAADHGLVPGSTLRLGVMGMTLRFQVRGVGLMVEHLVPSVDQHLTIPVRGSLVAVMMSSRIIRALPRFQLTPAPPFNELLVRLNDDASRPAVRSAVEGLVGTTAEVTWREEQHSVQCHRSRLIVFRDFLPTAMGVFEGMAAIVLVFAMRDLARGWRKEAGTLLAFGVPRWRLLAAWASLVTAMVATGVGLGAALSGAFGDVVARAYQEATGFPWVMPGNGAAPLGVAAAVAAALVPVGVAAIATEIRGPPLSLMRSHVEQEFTIGLTWLPIGRAERMGLRNVLRRPAASLAMALSIAGTLVMAASMYVFADAQDSTTQAWIAARRWDAMVDVRDDATSVIAAARDRGATVIEPWTALPGSLLANGRLDDRQILGWPVPSALQADGWLVAGRGLSADDADEILVTHRDLRDLGARLGDTVTVQAGDGSRPLRVVGVLHSYTLGQAIVGRATLDRIAGSTLAPAGAMLAGPPSMVNAMIQDPSAGRVLAGAAIADVVHRSNAGLVRVMRGYGHLGTVAAVVLLLAGLRARLREREAEHAALLAFGVPPPWIGRSLLAEAATLSLAGGVIALPLVRLTTLMFQRRIAALWMFVPLDVHASHTVATLAAPIALAVLGTLPATLSLRRLHLVEALSTRLGA